MLRDQLFNNPGSLLAGLLIWIPIAIWVFSLLGWAIQGEMDFLTSLAGICVGVGLGMTALMARQPYMAPLILGCVVLTTIAFPIVRSIWMRRELDAIDIEAIERAYDVLSLRPGNSPAKFKLARAIYKRGMPAHALAIAEEAYKQMPSSFFPEELKILQSWRHYRIQPDQWRPLDCSDCGHANRPGLTHCEKCGGWFLLHHAQGKWMGRGMVKKFVAAWVCLMVALVGIPFVAGSLSPGAAIPVIIGLMVLAVLFVAFTFRSEPAKTR